MAANNFKTAKINSNSIKDPQLIELKIGTYKCKKLERSKAISALVRESVIQI